MAGSPTGIRTALPRIGLALAIGAAGGALFAYFRLPLPWMTGAATATTVVALSGGPLQLPRQVRAIMASVLGVMLGSAFRPGMLEQIPQWLGSMTGLMVYVTLAGGLTLWYLRVLRRYPLVTAYFSATPGGFLEMVTMAEAFRGDIRTVALIHSVRIFLTVFTIPVWFRLTQGYTPSPTGLPPQLGAGLTLMDAAIMVGCAVFGYLGGRLLRIPAPFLLGPMLMSGILHVTGLVHSSPPAVVVALAQIAIGTSIGCRFTGYSIRAVLTTLLTGVGSAAFFLVLAALFSYALHPLTGIPTEVLLLAFSPGGLAEMSLVSFAMGIDPALVSSHHLLRIVFVVFMAPLIFRLFRGRLDDAAPESQPPP